MDHQHVTPAITPEITLRQVSLRVTAIRVGLLHALRRAKEPHSAAKLLQTGKLGQANETTIYRALETMTEAGIVRKLELGRGHALYELAGGMHHHHFSCERCHTITAVDIPTERSLLKTISSKYKVSIRDHAIELFGLCAKCRTA